jgi:thioesterase domain-containing protein
LNVTRAEIEDAYLHAWQSALKHKPVGVDDNIFGLGASSRLAATVFSELSAEPRLKELTLLDFFEYPSASLFASAVYERIAGIPQQVARYLLPLNEEKAGEPVYCVHPTNGEIVFMATMFDMANAGRPAIGIRSFGMDGECEPPRSVPDLAAGYLSLIRDMQSAGPYYLSGYCFGCLVAYEMAVQLLAAGDEVRFVGMIDPPMAASELGTDLDYEELRSFRLREMAQVCREARVLPDRADAEEFSAEEVLDGQKRLGRHRATDTLTQLNARLDIWATNVQAAASYAPPPLDLPLDMFMTTSGVNSFFPAQRRAHLVGGDHDSIFAEPELAALFGAALRLA